MIATVVTERVSKMMHARMWPGLFVLTVIFVTASAAGAFAADFAGGAGTAWNPYQIADANQLLAIGSDPDLLDKHFELIADIDLSGREFEGTVIEGPVGFEGFEGTFDGGGHTISHLNAALFKAVGGEVRDLRIENANVQAGTGSAGILARTNWGTIQDCYVTGRVSMSGHHVPGGYTASSAGGLVGANRGTIAALEDGDILKVSGIRKSLEDNSAITIHNDSQNFDIETSYDLSERERQILLAGGKLSYTVAST